MSNFDIPPVFLPNKGERKIFGSFFVICVQYFTRIRIRFWFLGRIRIRKKITDPNIYIYIHILKYCTHMTKNEPNVFLSTSFGKQNLSCKGRGVAEKNVLRIYMYNVCIYIQGWIKDLARGGGQNSRGRGKSRDRYLDVLNSNSYSNVLRYNQQFTIFNDF